MWNLAETGEKKIIEAMFHVDRSSRAIALQRRNAGNQWFSSSQPLVIYSSSIHFTETEHPLRLTHPHFPCHLSSSKSVTS